MSNKKVDLATPLGQSLGGWMEAAGHTSASLAAEVGVTPQAVRHWRAGNAIPCNTSWRPLARALKMDVEEVAVACIPVGP